MNDPFNAHNLDAELKAVGLKIHGCSSTGRIDWVEEPTEADLVKAQAVKVAHDPLKKPLTLTDQFKAANTLDEKIAILAKANGLKL